MVTHTNTDHVHVDVGLRWPDGFPRNRRRGWGYDIQCTYVERTLHSIHTNFICLTHRVPMVQVKDFLEEMQRKVVGLPCA